MMDQAGRLRDDVRQPKGELGKEIETRWEKEEEILVTVLHGMGDSVAISVRSAPK